MDRGGKERGSRKSREKRGNLSEKTVRLVERKQEVLTTIGCLKGREKEED